MVLMWKLWTGGEVEAWLAAAGGGSYDDDDNDDVVCACLRMPGQESDRACGQCETEDGCNYNGPTADCAENCIKKTDKDKCGCIFGLKCKGNLCEGKSCASE